MIALFPLLAWSLAASASTPAASAWNVVLIVADDLGACDLACDGSKYHRTPHLDQLARDGVRFTAAYAACPVCSPSRVAILTGQHPPRTGITDWLPGRPDRPDQKLARPPQPEGLAPAAVTLAERLQKSGRATAMMGKWHLGTGPMGPQAQGFEVNIAGDATGTPRSYFAPYRNASGTMPGLENAPEGEYLTDRLGVEAARFISAHKDRPFFLYLPHYAPHTPLKAPAETIARYQPGPAGRQGNPTYAAMIEHLDRAVGNVLASIASNGLADRTIVIFTSDNGGMVTAEAGPRPATINTPLREGKGFLYEGGIRVPLIVRAPGVRPAVCPVPVIGTDLTATLLDLLALPADAPKDGVSFAPALRGEAMPSRPLYWHYPHYANQGSSPGGAVRDGSWKYVEFLETGRAELFDLSKDPSESRNLALDQPEVTARLREDLAAWRQSISAKMPTVNSGYRPNAPAANGVITLPARRAEVRGRQLRYEPLPHKNTLGFWTDARDTAHWDFELPAAGRYSVEILQGCGAKQGGSEVLLKIGGAQILFTVEETGGWQNFVRRTLGTVEIAAGPQMLDVVPVKKTGVAIMDLREIVLRPVP